MPLGTNYIGEVANRWESIMALGSNYHWESSSSWGGLAYHGEVISIGKVPLGNNYHCKSSLPLGHNNLIITGAIANRWEAMIIRKLPESVGFTNLVLIFPKRN